MGSAGWRRGRTRYRPLQRRCGSRNSCRAQRLLPLPLWGNRMSRLWRGLGGGAAPRQIKWAGKKNPAFFGGVKNRIPRYAGGVNHRAGLSISPCRTAFRFEPPRQTLNNRASSPHRGPDFSPVQFSPRRSRRLGSPARGAAAARADVARGAVAIGCALRDGRLGAGKRHQCQKKRNSRCLHASHWTSLVAADDGPPPPRFQAVAGPAPHSARRRSASARRVGSFANRQRHSRLWGVTVGATNSTTSTSKHARISSIS